MSDWDFLHDMHNEGYSPEQISDAAACGYNPWDFDPPEGWELIKLEDEFQTIHEVHPEIIQIFENLVESAATYHSVAGRYLQIWGELGELFAEIAFGVKRHKPFTQGSDGKIGNDFIEIKTISPEKSNEQVQVKRAGNFNKLLIVKISENFEFDAKLIARKSLPKGEGKYARVSWTDPVNQDDAT